MDNAVVQSTVIAPMSDDAINLVYELEAVNLKLPQVNIETTHTLHDGVYTRTIKIPKNVRLTGALIKVPTTLIVSGSVAVFIGNKVRELEGYNVLRASAKRKQVFIARTDTYLTMIFATKALTIAEAENEFTDEAHLLMSRNEDVNNCKNIMEDE